MVLVYLLRHRPSEHFLQFGRGQFRPRRRRTVKL